MSMLAEPQYKKQKLSVDPRGSYWSKDDSKFGQKMLEKFGWSKGKGLGAKEDGNVDHVKVSLKNNNHGLGCSKTQVDNWIAHQDDFNALLANLNQSNEQKDSDKVISLENKSKTSRSRVHYQKFTKGKDLSAKSSEDLDCIFGRRRTTAENNTPSDSPDEEETKNDKGGFVTVRSEDSIQDYFAKKMASLKNKNTSQPELQSILKCQAMENTSDDSNDSMNKSSSRRVSFMIGDDNSDENKSCDGNESLDSKKSKKKKSKKRKHEETEHVVIEIEKEKTTPDEKSAAKKKKKEKRDFLENEQGAEDNIKEGQEESCSKKDKKGKKERVSCEEDNLDSERKKKKSISENDTNDRNSDDSEKGKLSPLVELKKCKKQKKEKIECEGEEKTESTEHLEIKDEKVNNKKKKKSKKEVNQIITDDSEKIDESIDENNVMNEKLKSKIDGKYQVEPTKEGLKLINLIKDFTDKNIPSEELVKKKKSKKTAKNDKIVETKKSVKKDKPVEIKLPEIIEDIEKSFKGSNVSSIEGYANDVSFQFDIQKKLKRKEKSKKKGNKKK